MKYGVLTFSYRNFDNFSRDFAADGVISVNVGDYMQTTAIRSMYKRLGVDPADIFSVDRDAIRSHAGEKTLTLMNGCFYRWCFPTPATIHPVFVGFQTTEPVVVEFLDYFRTHAPIGCRDHVTRDLFRKHGVEAFTTGCLTLSLAPRSSAPSNGKVFAVYGSHNAGFPAAALRNAPQSVLERVEFVSQRKPVHAWPLPAREMALTERFAVQLLRRYAREAARIVTPLHHAAAPALALGIPVTLCRRADDPRFSYLKEILPMHLPETYDAIDWDDGPINIDVTRERLIETTRTAIAKAISDLE